MSSNINNTKANIKKRLSIPAISEIYYKEKLLQTLKKDEKPPREKKKSTQDIETLKEMIFDKDNKSKILKEKPRKTETFSVIEQNNIKSKIEELQKELMEKEEEIKKLQNKLEEEKNKNQKMNDILAKKDIKISTLEKLVEKYEKEQENKINKSEYEEMEKNKNDIIKKLEEEKESLNVTIESLKKDKTKNENTIENELFSTVYCEIISCYYIN